jgi:Mrp family chromosome partitioning ATPase
MPIAAGLSQQLQLRRIKGERQEPPWVVLECAATLHVMGEGVIRSPGAILSREYEQCLTNLRSNYDYIIVDGPAVTSEVECRALAQLIQGVVLVVPRADIQLPPEVTSVFHDKQFTFRHGCMERQTH